MWAVGANWDLSQFAEGNCTEVLGVTATHLDRPTGLGYVKSERFQFTVLALELAQARPSQGPGHGRRVKGEGMLRDCPERAPQRGAPARSSFAVEGGPVRYAVCRDHDLDLRAEKSGQPFPKDPVQYIALLCMLTVMKLPKDLVAASAVPLVLSLLEEGESCISSSTTSARISVRRK